MGVGGYLAAKAEQDTFRHRYNEITNRLAVACNSELDREVHDILGPLGLQENVSRVVSRALARAQDDAEDREDRSSFDSAQMAHQRSLFGRLGLTSRPVPKTGTAAFLLKLGEGMEEVPSSRLFMSAVTIGVSYALGGILPIIPYFFIPVAYDALKWSIVSSSPRLRWFSR
jgi:VIT1/CCC1 family predicted Fe2+/Mn2+ transporter